MKLHEVPQYSKFAYQGETYVMYGVDGMYAKVAYLKDVEEFDNYEVPFKYWNDVVKFIHCSVEVKEIK